MSLFFDECMTALIYWKRKISFHPHGLFFLIYGNFCMRKKLHMKHACPLHVDCASQRHLLTCLVRIYDDMGRWTSKEHARKKNWTWGMMKFLKLSPHPHRKFRPKWNQKYLQLNKSREISYRKLQNEPIILIRWYIRPQRNWL